MKNITISLLFLFLLGCTVPNTYVAGVKYLPGDPFAGQMPESQFFDLDTRQDQVVRGKDGTLLVFQQGSIQDSNGKPYNGMARVELSEALRLSNMLLANLTTTSNNQPLITGGMIYLNLATPDGKPLSINPQLPAYIEMPTNELRSGMMAYQGVRDAQGNMDWLDPKPLADFLVPVDIFELDFLPEGFYDELERSIPFGSFKEAYVALADSLYYSFSAPTLKAMMRKAIPTEYFEPYMNNQVKDGQYTDESYVHKPQYSTKDTVPDNKIQAIDPAIIKAIRNEQFQHTLLATREFEQRLQWIFKSCNNKVIELYIQNLDKNLWELDTQAAELTKDKPNVCAAFKKFAQEKKTTVPKNNKTANALKRFFNQELQRIRTELLARKKAYIAAGQEEKEQRQAIADAYKKVLLARETRRMVAYGFEWSATGWINIDNGTEPKTWFEKPLPVTIANGQEYEQVYCYAVFLQLKSIHRLWSSDAKHYNVGSPNKPKLLIPKDSPFVIIAIGYKNGQMAGFGMERDNTDNWKDDEPIGLEAATSEQIRTIIAMTDNFDKANNIAADLEVQQQLAAIQAEQEAVHVLRKLWEYAFPCYPACNEILDKSATLERGKELFNANCASCHNKNMVDKLTGPALGGVTERWERYPRGDLYGFIRNSQGMIGSGHPLAVEQWNTWRPVLMNSFESLSDCELEALLAYIKYASRLN